MELAALFNFLFKQKFILLGVTLAGGILGLYIAFKTPTTFQASLLVYVQRESQPASDKFFNYDGYYALQTGTEYADTVLGLIKSLDVLKRGAEITQYIPQDTQELKKLSGKIKVLKKAPQLIEVSFTDQSQEKSQDVVSALAQASQDRIRILNQTGDKALVVGLVNQDPLVLVQTPATIYYILLGSGFGLIVGLFFSLILDFIKPKR